MHQIRCEKQTTLLEVIVRSKRNIKQNRNWFYFNFSVESSSFIFNPLTSVPAVTCRAKTHPQFPVPAVTGRKKACENNRLSYPPWRDFGSPIVLLLLRTNKPMRMGFLSIFWRTLGVRERRFFVLKLCARKVQVIMAHCGLNLQTFRVLFSFLKRTNHFFGT